MTLGELIDAFKDCDAREVRIAAPMKLVPQHPHSYRGYYEDLAIDYATAGEMSVEAFRAMLNDANGNTYCGWKGGEFGMHRDTTVWVSEEGNSSGMRVSGVEVDAGIAYIMLQPKRY